jgi:predicted GNAT family acetyltransferase
MAKALYNEKKDKAIDAKMLKGKSSAVKKEFKKLDAKHPKVKYQEQDKAIDKKLIKKAVAKAKKGK